MKYMLLMYYKESSLSESEREKCFLEGAEFAHELHTKGKYLLAAPLHPASTASSVRFREGSASSGTLS